MNTKEILSFEELCARTADMRAEGKRVVLTHGVFDLLHIGHVNHLKRAREIGDVLVVSIIADRYVKRGPHRPAFSETVRSEVVQALEYVDMVAISPFESASEVVEKLLPDFFCKGVQVDGGEEECGHHHLYAQSEDLVITKMGVEVVVTGKESHSSSALINRYSDIFSPEVKAYLGGMADKYSASEIIDNLRKLDDLNVLVVGETIIDEYNFCNVLSKANKDPILAVNFLYKQKYGGGVVAIANHIASFCSKVTMLSMLGEENTQEEFIRSKLSPSVTPLFHYRANSPTIVKSRFLQEYMAIKLFEVYGMKNSVIGHESEQALLKILEEPLERADVVIVADYGHGMIAPGVVEMLCKKAKYLAVNTQTNAGNFGFNVISKYPKLDFASMDEPEARLVTHDMISHPRDVIKRVAEMLECRHIMVTRGKNGSLIYDCQKEEFTKTPAFSIKVVDRIGAGDAVLAVTAPCLSLGVPLDQLGFIANVVGAEACTIMGNERAINPSSVVNNLISLLKK